MDINYIFQDCYTVNEILNINTELSAYLKMK